jgi:hypothetical protein
MTSKNVLNGKRGPRSGAILFLFLCAMSRDVSAEEFLCTYSWPGKSESHSVLLEVTGDRGMTRGGVINQEYRVAANTTTELLMYRSYTKANSGNDYPVGLTTIVLDKATKAFVLSNSFAGGNQNNHAKGSCEVVYRD